VIPVGSGNDPKRDFTDEYALSQIHAKLVPGDGSLLSHPIYLRITNPESFDGCESFLLAYLSSNHLTTPLIDSVCA
jgi:hypothetical protein